MEKPNKPFSDERLKYADEDFDAHWMQYIQPGEVQRLVADLVREVKRLRALSTQFQRDNSALISRLALYESRYQSSPEALTYKGHPVEFSPSMPTTDEPGTIAHAAFCPVSQPGYIPDVTPGHKSACTCDFGERLARHFGLRVEVDRTP